MSPLRKSATAWCLVATAVTVSALGGSFLYLQNDTYSDVGYVETHIRKIAAERSFNLDEARREGYSDPEIAAYLSKKDARAFERDWSRLALVIGLVYVIVVLGIVASALAREARTSTSKDDA